MLPNAHLIFSLSTESLKIQAMPLYDVFLRSLNNASDASFVFSTSGLMFLINLISASTFTENESHFSADMSF